MQLTEMLSLIVVPSWDLSLSSFHAFGLRSTVRASMGKSMFCRLSGPGAAMAARASVPASCPLGHGGLQRRARLRFPLAGKWAY